ncbi:hypothetical protein [Fibrobacter sp.]|uniref:hypothetical protein n=1 Tax=Fibrobacter sp. TaxID=35828 RepID=UPI00388FA3D1
MPPKLYGLNCECVFADEIHDEALLRYVNVDTELTKHMLNAVCCNGNFEKGEVIKAMQNNDVLVKVGNKYYRPSICELKQGLPSLYPDLNIDVHLSPSDEVTVKEQTNPFAIKDVIFNDPATIVLWKDGTKTVVKIQNGEEFDPEKGLAMAIAKKALGNKGNYFDVFKEYNEKYEECMAKEQEKEQKKNDEVFAFCLKAIFGNGAGPKE